MPITLKTITVFHCHCIRCGHKWDVKTKPGRCANCKSRTWNGEDHRQPDPYIEVPLTSQIRNGTGTPEHPSSEEMLGTFVKARRVIAQLIHDNPCDHSHGACVCADKITLAEIDQRIEKLENLKPKRSTYLLRRRWVDE